MSKTGRNDGVTDPGDGSGGLGEIPRFEGRYSTKSLAKTCHAAEFAIAAREVSLSLSSEDRSLAGLRA